MSSSDWSSYGEIADAYDVISVPTLSSKGGNTNMPVSSKPSLRFFYSKTLRARTIRLLDSLEGEADPTQHTSALGDLVVALTEAGMGYYFLTPLQLAKIGFVTRQTASFGVGSALKMMSPMIRTIIGRMDKKQVLRVCHFIRSLM